MGEELFSSFSISGTRPHRGLCLFVYCPAQPISATERKFSSCFAPGRWGGGHGRKGHPMAVRARKKKNSRWYI